MDSQENEIEDILNSLDGLQPATANPFLFEKIKSSLALRARPSAGRTILRWALTGAFVLALNVATWTQIKREAPSDSLNAVAQQLGFSNSSYQY